MGEPSEGVMSGTDPFSQNPSFRQLAFIAAIVLLLGAWKFGLEGLLE